MCPKTVPTSIKVADNVVLRIRMSRIRALGIPKRAPIYNIYIADARAPRDGTTVEYVGRFESAPDADKVKHIQLNFDRIKYWLARGAQPTQTVALILGRAGILPSIPRGVYAEAFQEPAEADASISTNNQQELED